ncbi:MAG: hypothetical protein IJX80_00530 [Clostridia bacterium]|nr:hypothetical protein [Clostridia bacterium]
MKAISDAIPDGAWGKRMIMIENRNEWMRDISLPRSSVRLQVSAGDLRGVDRLGQSARLPHAAESGLYGV